MRRQASSICSCMRRYASSEPYTPQAGRPVMERSMGEAHGGAVGTTSTVQQRTRLSWPDARSSTSRMLDRPSEQTAPEVPLALRDQRGQPRYATWYPPAKRTDETPAWAAPRAPVVSLASIPAKDRKLVSRVQFYAYTVDVSRLEFFSDFAGRAADTLGIPTVTRTCETDVQAVTIIRGPFVHAKSKEAIWRRTHAREIAAYNAAPSVVEAWHAYLKRTVMPGLGIRFETIGYHEVGFGQQMGRGAKGRKPKSANGSKKVDGPIASSASASASAP